jgi:hypothetical protein
MHLQPLSLNSLFSPEEEVRARLEERQKLASTSSGSLDLEATACTDFKAAAAFSSRAAHYDRMGIAAFVCRHGFVACMVSLHTPENFTYYEMLLEALHDKMDLANVDAIFLDVACKFEAYYDRYTTDAGPEPSMGSIASIVSRHRLHMTRLTGCGKPGNSIWDRVIRKGVYE